MIDYIDMKLTVNCDAEIERAVEFLSHLCAEAYVGATKPYNPSWCTVDKLGIKWYPMHDRSMILRLAEIVS